MNSHAVRVRAPGRVNLIGEHTDYSQLPVMPIAIDRALTIEVIADESNVLGASSEQFPEKGELPRGVHVPQHGWLRYIAGALQQMEGLAAGRGATVQVSGDLPASGGLSSSSALTVGVLAGLNEAWGAGLDREEIVRRAIVAERHVGVETGGMDQEAIAFAEAGHALRIDFLPHERRKVAIPDGLAFLVAYSGEEAPKGGAAREAYNERVVGARLAAVLLADAIGVDLDHPATLGQVASVDVVDLLVDDLPDKSSAHSVAHGVAADVTRLVTLSHSSVGGMVKVPIKPVARHILSEAQRVDAAEAALKAGDLKAFGAILNASHDSLRQDFRCSTPALDRVCAAMRKGGAFGARLTGAGFGGYALAACAPDRVEAIVEAAKAAAGGPAFQVHPSKGLEVE
ncbi:MAG TPA: galactokinase family protein [Tepidiformaceae bacterium]|nr:galactokinase family protein [Tepidiformaceae bacterium]